MPLPTPYVSPAVLAQRTLRHMGVLTDNEQPSPDESALVTDEYTAMHAEMTSKGEIEWPYEMVPQEAVSGIVGILAARLGPDFGKSSLADKSGLVALARREFFAVNARPHSAAPARGEYF